MSLELVNTLATVGTFLVIAATAIAAIVQLRHMRSSNQIAALNELRESIAKHDFQAAEHFVRTELPGLLKDPAFRYELGTPAARTAENRQRIQMVNVLANFYEGMGLLVKTGLVNPALALDMWSTRLAMHWKALAPVIAIMRRKANKGLWENFEYIVVLSQAWIAAHPKGAYPPGMRRIELDDEWLEADARYAAYVPEAADRVLRNS